MKDFLIFFFPRVFLGLATGSSPVAKPGYERRGGGEGGRVVGGGSAGLGERKKKRSVENLNKYANIVTVINSWHAPVNE